MVVAVQIGPAYRQTRSASHPRAVRRDRRTVGWIAQTLVLSDRVSGHGTARNSGLRGARFSDGTLK